MILVNFIKKYDVFCCSSDEFELRERQKMTDDNPQTPITIN
jgi:hypothetical protein